MDQFERYYRFDNIIRRHRLPVSRQVIEKELEISRATFQRMTRELQAFGVPLEFDRDRNGWYYQQGVAFELPGMWFTHGELFALMTAHELLANTEPSLLKDALEPLRKKIDVLMAAEHLGAGELPKRVRIIRVAGRGPGLCFASVARALVERRQLQFDYRARTTSTDSSRTVAPQRLTHYRDNWYLDAWCHERKDLRSFALERVVNARVGEKAARNIATNKLHDHFASAYGIFAGKPIATARLIFSAHRAQWVADEMWHPAQRGLFLPDGRYQLDIPYSHSRELLMDVLKNGADVEIVAPESLRNEAIAHLTAALKKYENGPKAAPVLVFCGVTE